MSAQIVITVDGTGNINVSVQPAEMMADKIVMLGLLETVKDVVREAHAKAAQRAGSGIVTVPAMPDVLKRTGA